MTQSARPHAVNGVTTAVNDTVTDTSKKTAIAGGSTVKIAVGAEPIHVRYGKENDTVTTTNGFWRPANSMDVETIPNGATHIHYIRAGSSNGTISMEFCEGGI